MRDELDWLEMKGLLSERDGSCLGFRRDDWESLFGLLGLIGEGYNFYFRS